MSNSFIYNAFQATTDYRGTQGKVGSFINRFADSDTEDNFLNMFEDAIASTAENEVFHPLQIIGHLQTIMNKVCWNARRLHEANIRDDAPWGVDPSETAQSVTGVSVDNAKLTAVVDSDFDTLTLIQCELSQLFDDMYIAPLYYFTEDEKQPNGDWFTTVKCESFDDAFTHMTEIADKLRIQGATDIKERIAARRAARKAA